MAKGEKKAKQLQRRRLRAGRLLAKGVPQAEVTRRVKVSRPTVCEWDARLQQGGLDALKRRQRGRPARMNAAMRVALIQALKAGALAHGYAEVLSIGV